MVLFLYKKKSRWCLAKDDVSPQDIFRLTNQGSAERAIVANIVFRIVTYSSFNVKK